MLEICDEFRMRFDFDNGYVVWVVLEEDLHPELAPIVVSSTAYLIFYGPRKDGKLRNYYIEGKDTITGCSADDVVHLLEHVRNLPAVDAKNEQ